MLYATKQMYSVTKCTLRFFGHISEEFETHSGIRQGSASSCILFIIYMDKIVSFIASKCVEEPMIGALHILLHADDTLIISTSKDNFITKCTAMFQYFNTENMLLNMNKSGYMIFNATTNDIKQDLVIAGQILMYKQNQIYLGLLFNDNGNISSDIDEHTKQKSSNITIKLQNFLIKNKFAPLNVKMKVLNACVNSSLMYGCESWAYGSLNSISTLHRKALKLVLGIRSSIPNSITYIESGIYPIKNIIISQQLKFWLKTKDYAQNNPISPIAKMLHIAKLHNVCYT